MTMTNRRFIRWLAGTISCERFAMHVAEGITPPSGGLKGRLYFWLHWFWCPYCRRYWNQIETLGAVHRATMALSAHPAIKILELKARLKAQLRDRCV